MRFFSVYLNNFDQRWSWQLYRPAVFFPGHLSVAMNIKIVINCHKLSEFDTFQSLTHEYYIFSLT